MPDLTAENAEIAAACRPPEIHTRPTDAELAAVVRALEGTGDPAYVLGAELIDLRARVAELEAQQRRHEIALGQAWDDGNATGLDGWVGPGRGAGEVDDEAERARERAIEAGLGGIVPAPVQEPAGYVVGWQEADGGVSIALDESEPNPCGSPDRFAWRDLGEAQLFLAEIAPEDPDTPFVVYALHEVADRPTQEGQANA